MKKKLIFILIVLGCALVVGITFRSRFFWVAKKVHREVFPEQVAEGPVYARTAVAAVDLAEFVEEARKAWPGASMSIVHGAAVDVATGLLYHSDIEVGSLVNGVFVTWQMPPWDAAERVRQELGQRPGFLEERGRYVFRRNLMQTMEKGTG